MLKQSFEIDATSVRTTACRIAAAVISYSYLLLLELFSWIKPPYRGQNPVSNFECQG